MTLPNLFAFLLLALWLQPSISMAEGPLPPSEASVPTNIPADYPEDFSQPGPLAQAPDYTDAFGEDEASQAHDEAPAVDLFAPLDKPTAAPSEVPAPPPK